MYEFWTELKISPKKIPKNFWKIFFCFFFGQNPEMEGKSRIYAKNRIPKWRGSRILKSRNAGIPCIVPVKSKVKILQNFVAFSGYMNFISALWMVSSKFRKRLHGNKITELLIHNSFFCQCQGPRYINILLFCSFVFSPFHLIILALTKRNCYWMTNSVLLFTKPFADHMWPAKGFSAWPLCHLTSFLICKAF